MVLKQNFLILMSILNKLLKKAEIHEQNNQIFNVNMSII